MIKPEVPCLTFAEGFRLRPRYWGIKKPCLRDLVPASNGGCPFLTGPEDIRLSAGGDLFRVALPRDRFSILPSYNRLPSVQPFDGFLGRRVLLPAPHPGVPICFYLSPQVLRKEIKLSFCAPWRPASGFDQLWTRLP